METELKILLSGRDLERIPRARCLGGVERGRARSAMLDSTYYDTADLALRRKGMALRLRKEGRSWRQTLKAAGKTLGGLHERQEYEWIVPGERIDVELLKQTALGHIFAKARLSKRLQPVFRTQFRRRSVPLRFADGSSAVLALDSGTITAGRRTEPICEAEVELADGNALPVLDLAASLLDEIPCRIGHRSKAERAYALLSGRAQPRKWASPRLDPQGAASLACLQLMDACASQVQDNEDGFLAGRDTEYLHQMRAGMRRLRVALAMPRDQAWRAALAPLTEDLKWASALLGSARNWDVFAGELLPPLAQACGAGSLAALCSRVARHRREAGQAARQAVRSSRYQLLCLALARLGLGVSTAGPGLGTHEFAHRVLARRYRKLIAWNQPAGLDPDELHRLRIATKKMRYVAEFFSSLHPGKKTKRFTARLEALQALLGAINDARVSTRMIEVCARGGRAALDREVIGLAKGWIAAREAAARESLDTAWQEFRSLEPYWI